MQKSTRAVLISNEKYQSKKDMSDNRCLTMLAQADKGLGVLKYFIPPMQVESPMYKDLKPGMALSIDVDMVENGFSSYPKVLSVTPTPSVAVALSFTDDKGKKL